MITMILLLLTIVDQGQPPSPVCSPTHPLIQPTNQPSKSSQVLHISILLMWKESDGKTTEVATFFCKKPDLVISLFPQDFVQLHFVYIWD